MDSHEGTARWERLAPGVARRRMPVWDATIGVIEGAAGVLLVDTGASLPEGAEVRREVRELTGRDVTHIALTHPHFDHVFGTAAFPEAEVYGPVGLGEVLTRDHEELWRDAVRHGLDPTAAAEAAAALVRPRHAVSGELALDLGGGRRVLLANVGPGHTAHDIDVLIAGGGGGGGA
ncbi:MBL fold metallo-hydrolase, partial [Streptomyces sp. UNOC14_S4]|uniref:MBL fold metallo-hydrolase n=1 Tax=Streptomyces sp. UNOC14_S4 TaxID=2872340 RepID=UPI001E31F558